MFLGRRRMAEHILMNLCKNAFQAMEKTERKELLIRLEAKGYDMICLQVSDTGCGIGDDAMQKIFEPFYDKSDPGRVPDSAFLWSRIW